MSRYLVIGYSGSGKSTLARRISHLSSIPYFDTDKLYWSNEWSLLSDDKVVMNLPLDADSWILDGNFLNHRDQVWSKASSIIWVDPPAFVVMYRLITRNLTVWASRKPSWGGSRMPFKVAVSGIIHGWRRLFKNRSNFSGFLKEYPDKSIHHIRSHSEYKSFLTSIEPKK